MFVLCTGCQKEIRRKPSRSIYYKSHYCSPDCKSRDYSKSEMVVTTCGTCEKEIQKKVVSVRRSKSGKVFCSKSCSAKHRRSFRVTSVTVNCFTCGKEVLRQASQKRRSKSGKSFCSQSCSNANNNRSRIGTKHPNWNDGITTYRAKALQRFGHCCANVDCPFKNVKIPVQMLDVDHIDSNRRNNDIFNLQVLCVWCHALKTRKINVGLSFNGRTSPSEGEILEFKSLRASQSLLRSHTKGR